MFFLILYKVISLYSQIFLYIFLVNFLSLSLRILPLKAVQCRPDSKLLKVPKGATAFTRTPTRTRRLWQPIGPTHTWRWAWRSLALDKLATSIVVVVELRLCFGFYFSFCRGLCCAACCVLVIIIKRIDARLSLEVLAPAWRMVSLIMAASAAG